MMALSMTQPWASLVAAGAKRYETRHWLTTYRGPLAIHAARSWTVCDRELCDEEPFADILHAAGYARASQLPRGAIVAVVDLVACLPTDELWHELATHDPDELELGDFSPGRYAWALANIRPLLEPVPCRGALGVWRVPEDACARVEAQIHPARDGGTR